VTERAGVMAVQVSMINMREEVMGALLREIAVLSGKSKKKMDDFIYGLLEEYGQHDSFNRLREILDKENW